MIFIILIKYYEIKKLIFKITSEVGIEPNDARGASLANWWNTIIRFRQVPTGIRIRIIRLEGERTIRYAIGTYINYESLLNR